jgi:hypothetical protein
MPLGMYWFTSLNLTHSYPATHNDHLPKYTPPTPKQIEMVHDLMSIKTLGHSEIHMLLNSCFLDHPLSLRQVSNMLNNAKWQVQNRIESLGGDIILVVQALLKWKEDDNCWVVHVCINEDTQQFKGVFLRGKDACMPLSNTLMLESVTSCILCVLCLLD